VLGIAVEVKTAGARTGTITLPGEAQKSVDAAVTLAGTTYNGILTDGLASVSLGDGKISGDLTADIESASLGVFVMTRERMLPADEAAALALIKSTFPGIATLNYVAKSQQGKGYSFQATTTTQALDPSSRQYVSVSQSALLLSPPVCAQGGCWYGLWWPTAR
jgi:hypothetical protein